MYYTDKVKEVQEHIVTDAEELVGKTIRGMTSDHIVGEKVIAFEDGSFAVFSAYRDEYEESCDVCMSTRVDNLRTLVGIGLLSEEDVLAEIKARNVDYLRAQQTRERERYWELKLKHESSIYNGAKVAINEGQYTGRVGVVVKISIDDPMADNPSIGIRVRANKGRSYGTYTVDQLVAV
jgi:hypothetical protein